MSLTTPQSTTPSVPSLRDVNVKRSSRTLTSIHVTTPFGAARGLEPIRQGIPLSRGAVKDETNIRLVDELGQDISVQTRVLSNWADGSIQWLLLDILHPAENRVGHETADGETLEAESTTFEKVYGVQIFENPPTLESKARKSNATQLPNEFSTAWGLIKVGSSETANTIFQIDEKWNGRLVVRLMDGRELTLDLRDTNILESGPIRTVVEMHGDLVDSTRAKILDGRFEFHFFSELKLIKCTFTLGNPMSASHPGGIWELGDPGSVGIADASVLLNPMGSQPSQSASCGWSVDGAHQMVDGVLPWSLYQDSSGGDQWNCSNHVDQDGNVPLRFRGFEMAVGEKIIKGDRATPMVEYRTGSDLDISVSFPQFWQNFPKSISLSPSELRIGLFPAESDRAHELQGGEQKTHQFWIGGNQDKGNNLQATSTVSSVHNSSKVWIDPRAIAATCVMPWLTSKSEDQNDKYLSLVNAAIEGEDTYFQKRETIDEYGWRHFGDIYADHEAVFDISQAPLISHYNNQYDAVLGFGIQFLRAGDERWVEMMRDLAWHVVDIDIYHAESDKNAYNGGQFWHTFHYIGAGKATHRSYPQGTCGGGPASEQGYARGLGLYYFLTGEEMMRKTVDRMGQWIISADDGSRTPFRYLSQSGTGLTSASGTLDYQGPGRGAGNAIELSVAAFEVTGRKEFLDEAEKLIRRVIHPNDDIASRNLLDAERRWYYNLFLQSLGRYLWVKHQIGQHGFMYGYGRASLLHYAKWMCENEYPYLTKPEILEYPTETWAAQDMRKCEVFQWASLHAAGEFRDQLLERAKFFFDYSTDTLSEMETRTLCRPVALLLSNGYSRAWFDNPSAIPTLPDVNDSANVDYGSPEQFTPQKIQAIKRAKFIAAVGVIVFVLALGWIVSSSLLD